MKRYLLDLGAIALAEKDGQPAWNLLFPLGAVKWRPDFPKGKATFDEKFLGTLADNFKKMQARHKGEKFALQLNYLHPEPGQAIENHRAAGWIEDVELREDGLYVLVKWTQEAREFIAKDAFRYLSPEFSFDWQDADTGKRQGPTLWGAALLNTPFLKELPRVAASEQSNPPDPSGPEGAAPMMKELRAVLGMPEDSSDEEVMEKCKSLMSKMNEFEKKDEPKEEPMDEEKKAAEQAEQVKLAEVQGAVLKLTAENKALSDKLQKLESERKTTEVKAFFDELINAGKCTPSSRQHFEPLALKHGLDDYRFMRSEAPVVQLGEVGVSGSPVPEDPKVAAGKAWEAKLSELCAKGLKPIEAHNTARAELPKEFELLFS